MYTPDDRERVRADLIAAARADPRIGGGALTGSASLHNSFIARLQTYPGVGHSFVPAMRDDTIALFLGS